jgi:hypothetical protein
MSRTSEVLKNKNKVEKSAFKAKLYDELKHVEVILQDADVDAVIVTVPKTSLPQFTASIYSEDLAGYDIEQVEDEADKFLIRRKFISF